MAFDGTIEEGQAIDQVYKRVVGDETLAELLEGVSLGVFRLDGGDDGPDRNALFSLTLRRLEALLRSRSQEISPSFGLYSVTDTHCVNLKSFEQVEYEEIAARLASPNVELEPLTEGFGELMEILEKGYSGSCVLFLRMRVESVGGPVCWSTLALGELYAAGLERSLTQLRTIALSLEQPHGSGVLPFDQCKLTAMLEPFIGGCGRTRFLFSLAQHAAGVEAKALNNVLSLAEALRRVKCRPAAYHEALEVRELARLLAASEALEAEQRDTKQQVRTLRKDLARLSGDKLKLEGELSLANSDGQVAVWEREWRLARLALENAGKQDELRKAEARLVWGEHRQAALDAAVFESRYRLAEAEAQLADAQRARDTEAQEYEERLAELQTNLHSSNKEMEATVAKMERDAKQQSRQADARVAQLEARLNEAEGTRRRLESDLDDVQRKWDQDKRQRTDQEQRAANETKAAIEKIRADERALRDELHTVLSERRKATGVIEDLERELNRLRIENATLSAKLDIYSQFNHARPSSDGNAEGQLKATLAKFEERMAQERAQTMSMLQLLKPEAKTAEPVKKPAPAVPKKKELVPPKDNAASLMKMVKAIPTKRSSTAKPRAELGEQSGPASDPHSDYMEQDEEPAVKKQAAIKLKPKKTPQETVKENKEPAPQLFVRKTDALSAIQKHTAPLDTPAAPRAPESPIKARSTFIPGVAKPSAAVANASKPRFLANMNFDSGAGAASHSGPETRRRIKLPERGIGSSSMPVADGAGGAASRRNIDPAVYSTIVSGFNIKKD